jgi:hypothetical protein
LNDECDGFWVYSIVEVVRVWVAVVGYVLGVKVVQMNVRVLRTENVVKMIRRSFTTTSRKMTNFFGLAMTPAFDWYAPI